MFEAMLCPARIGEAGESLNDGGSGSAEERAGNIRITDVEPEAFEELLRFGLSYFIFMKKWILVFFYLGCVHRYR